MNRSSRLRALLLSPAARPLRFAGTGGAAAALQLFLLTLMTHRGIAPFVAELLAFLIAAQLNFALSSTFTWHERRGGSLAARWLAFHASIAATAALNLVAFALARHFIPILLASALGIAVGALGNYAAGELLVFRARPARIEPQHDRRYAA